MNFGRAPTSIGRVRHVLGSTVTVELDSSLAGVEPLWEGRVHSIGQIGSLVRIPQGPTTLIASVVLVGIAELTRPSVPSHSVQQGNRWLQVQLIGELTGNSKFTRGVSRYPGIDDIVHFSTPSDLAAVYPLRSRTQVRIGRLSASPEIEVTLTAASLVMRHSAIVGSTGSGKTSAVATLLQQFAAGDWNSANIVVIDPHGEYASALQDSASVRSVLGTGERLLEVPFWALPPADVFRALCPGMESNATIARFSELALLGKRAFLTKCKWLNLDPSSLTPDTVVPFDLREVWHTLAYDNQATYEKAGGQGATALLSHGSAEDLQPATFRPYSLGSAAPYKGPAYGHYGAAPDRIRARLRDSRFAFFTRPCGADLDSDPLAKIVADWLGGDKPVSVLDFSGVPAEVTDLAIGAVLQTLFEISVRSKEHGVGRARPTLIVLEEAHRYLSDGGGVRLARESANRIAREGRKYGIGLCLVTQRPSELPATALSQCGTIIALRLTNSSDQSAVKASLPDSVSGFADVLPALRTGEAIVAGEAVSIPTRVLIDMPVPAPDAADPSLESWRASSTPNDVANAIARWREG